MFIAELDHPRFADFDLSTLRTGIMAGSPCPIEVMKRVQSEMNMGEVTIAYGMTETSPSAARAAPTRRWTSACRPSARCSRTWRSRSSTPRPAAPCRVGERGEFCTRGYSVMHGYWGDARKTAEAIDAERLDAHRRPGDHGRARATSTSSGASRTW
jgi:fatty-acyl-CoA synthase